MDPLSASNQNSDAMGAKDVLLLKKSQDFAKQQANALIESLPPPAPAGSANSPGVGGQVDLHA